MTDFTRPVTVSTVDPADNLIVFQGDFTFDESIVTFQNPPVSSSGITATDWNVTGTILPGFGPIRTLRVWGFATDGVTPLSGTGTLFDLNMTRVSEMPGASSDLVWADPPDNLVFVDAKLVVHEPASAPPGQISIASVSIDISGAVSLCANSTPVSGVTMTLSGDASESTVSDSSGNYNFGFLVQGGTYTVTPTKPGLAAGSPGISTIDVVAVQRHYLNLIVLPPGCPQLAADATGDGRINTLDLVAIQRFFLAVPSGTANVGKFIFIPTNRTYPSVGNSQTGQNYSTIVLGDVASPYAH